MLFVDDCRKFFLLPERHTNNKSGPRFQNCQILLDEHESFKLLQLCSPCIKNQEENEEEANTLNRILLHFLDKQINIVIYHNFSCFTLAISPPRRIVYRRRIKNVHTIN